MNKIDQLVEENQHLIEEVPAARAMARATAASPEEILTKICNIAIVAVPIVKFARGLLFWKPKWQKVLDTLLTSLNMICPVEDDDDEDDA